MVKTGNLFLIAMLIFSLITLVGCIESNVQSPPFSVGQFVSRATDLNYSSWKNSDYNNMVLVFKNDKVSVADANDLNVALPDLSAYVKYQEASQDLNISGNVHIDGNVSFKRPYGMFSSMETQTAVAGSNAYVVDFNWVEDSYLVEKVGDVNFSVGQSGDYKIDLSAIVTVDTPNKSIEIWVRKNGVDIPRSNTRVVVPSAATETLIVVPFIIDLLPSDVFSVMWASNDAGSQLVATGASSYAPASPSIIMTLHKVSEIPSM